MPQNRDKIQSLDLISNPHVKSAEQVLKGLHTSERGLSLSEVPERRKKYGSNKLPVFRAPNLLIIFIRQFLNPLIYVLGFAALISLFLGHLNDTFFILAILLLNAVIGTIQEYGAEKSAEALQKLTPLKAYVLRDGEYFEIPSEELVPGDIVVSESGTKIPADLRLITANSLQIDESLLTGESTPVSKNQAIVVGAETPLADRQNMAFSGTMVNFGRGTGVVVGTGIHTEMGRIAETILKRKPTVAPLLLRMKSFSQRIMILLLGVVIFLGGVLIIKGGGFVDVLLLSVALAVSAIPEGLPVAVTIALAIASHRMSKRQVLIRKLPAVEALGSCTYIASDKTGTLTMNEITVRKVVFPKQPPIEMSGSGMVPEGELVVPSGFPSRVARHMVQRLTYASVLCNDGFLGKRNKEWVHYGDMVDVSLLVMGHKIGITKPALSREFKHVASIPFESERQYAATLDERNHERVISVKGAYERLLPMCSRMVSQDEEVEIDREHLEKQAQDLANEGYRVLAIAGVTQDIGNGGESFSSAHLKGLTFLGLVGMIDPLRPQAKEAIQVCRTSGIKVAMVTGDHPLTALAIARELGLGESLDEVVTGQMLHATKTDAEFDELAQRASIFARIEPHQKFKIVQVLKKQNHFVATTGDGANDAAALKASHVGIALGKSGTDVARETSDLILTDDRFSSIVAGIEEGRVAYSNIRKVVYLLIATGASEVVLFILSIFAGLPLPLTAVQLLWLNLVTNGIQDMALAFEPAEGDELLHPPRSPREPIFNRLMNQRVILSAMVVGVMGFVVYRYLLNSGWPHAAAQNSLLLLMVLFENVMVGNSRSETMSAFKHSPLRNPLLLFGTITAQLIHIASMHVPFMQKTLGVQPVSFKHWVMLLTLAISVFLVIELHKLIWKAFNR